MDVCLRASARTRRARHAALCLALVGLVPGTGLAASVEGGAEASPGGEPAIVAPAAALGELAGPPAFLLRSRLSLSEMPSTRMRLGAWRADTAIATAGQLADLVSTEVALSRSGTREANPLIANRGVRIPAKLAVAATTSLACYELRKRGRNGTARALAIASFVVGAAAAIHNARVGH
jgi:hypothetical protein